MEGGRGKKLGNIFDMVLVAFLVGVAVYGGMRWAEYIWPRPPVEIHHIR